MKVQKSVMVCYFLCNRVLGHISFVTCVNIGNIKKIKAKNSNNPYFVYV